MSKNNSKLLLTSLAAGALALTSCVKPGTVIGLRSDSPHMTTHAYRWENESGLARALVCNEVVDLNGDGVLERHDYLGLRRMLQDSTFYPNEKITVLVYAVAPWVMHENNRLEYTLINPNGAPVHTDSIVLNNLEHRGSYVVPDSQKMLGKYSLKVKMLGNRKAEHTISPMFEITP